MYWWTKICCSYLERWTQANTVINTMIWWWSDRMVFQFYTYQKLWKVCFTTKFRKRKTICFFDVRLRWRRFVVDVCWTYALTFKIIPVLKTENTKMVTLSTRWLRLNCMYPSDIVIKSPLSLPKKLIINNMFKLKCKESAVIRSSRNFNRV